MIRMLFWVTIVLGFSLLEVSFFASLPDPIYLTPFVFAIGVYLIQHQGVSVFAWWLVFHGLFLDLLQMGNIPAQVVTYSVGAIVATYTARHLFSNRSYYGVLSCALVGFLATLASEALILLGQSFTNTNVHWTIFGTELIQRVILLMILTTILYPFAKRIRGVLVRSLILPETRRTY